MSDSDFGAFAPGKLLTDGGGELPPEAAPLGSEPEHAKPTDVSWGDWTLDDSGKPLKHRHEVIAYMAASGASNRMIAQDLGLSDSRVSILLSNTRIKARIQQIRDAHWGANIQNRFQNTVPKAAQVMEEMISGEIPGLKPSERWDAAKWLLEKVTGKPRQEIDLDGGNTMLQLIAALDQLKLARAAGTLKPEERNVLESAEGGTSEITVIDPLDEFVSTHVPEPRSEKGT